MPQILTTILTRAAIALVEAALVRLALQLWKTFTASGARSASYA